MTLQEVLRPENNDLSVGAGNPSGGDGSAEAASPQSNSQAQLGGAGPVEGSRTSQSRNQTFTYPTPKDGDFALAMSQIACNPSSTAQGWVGSENNNFSRQLFDQLQLALAVKLGLNGPQEVKQRALYNVLTKKSARGDMRQILRSRVEMYGDELDPRYFDPGADLG